jgi:uncharacterized lipoprotein YmbA
MKRTASIVLAAILLWGCGMPATKMYTLQLPDTAELSDEANDATLALIVHAPKYLSQPYIAYRNSPYELRIAKYSKWESPPNRMIGDIFRERILSSGIFHEVKILRTSRPGVYRLDLNIRKFERLDEGRKSFGLFVIHANLTDAEGNLLFRKKISKKEELTDSRFETLAKEMSILVRQAYEEISTEILSHSAR